jgi:hypothetical protein
LCKQKKKLHSNRKKSQKEILHQTRTINLQKKKKNKESNIQNYVTCRINIEKKNTFFFISTPYHRKKRKKNAKNPMLEKKNINNVTQKRIVNVECVLYLFGCAIHSDTVAVRYLCCLPVWLSTVIF